MFKLNIFFDISFTLPSCSLVSSHIQLEIPKSDIIIDFVMCICNEYTHYALTIIERENKYKAPFLTEQASYNFILLPKIIIIQSEVLVLLILLYI